MGRTHLSIIAIAYFCKFPGHCGLGMVGTINAQTSGNNSFEAYQAAAQALGANEPTVSHPRAADSIAHGLDVDCTPRSATTVSKVVPALLARLHSHPLPRRAHLPVRPELPTVLPAAVAARTAQQASLRPAVPFC